MTSMPDGRRYWLTNAHGTVSPHGYAVSFGSMSGLPLNAPIARIVSTSNGRGYWEVASDGGIFAFGAPCSMVRPQREPWPPSWVQPPIPPPVGTWLVDADGRVHTY
jgi:hypothetical protein